MLLAQREHSRAELRRKLAPMARADAGGDEEVAAARVDALLDWLEAQGHLSQERFVESRLHIRAARFGNRRIEQELAQHGLRLDGEARAQLRDSELERARAVWARKYGHAPVDAAERLRQMRFLAGRGFAPKTIRQVVPRGEPGDAHGTDSSAPQAVDAQAGVPLRGPRPAGAEHASPPSRRWRTTR